MPSNWRPPMRAKKTGQFPSLETALVAMRDGRSTAASSQARHPRRGSGRVCDSSREVQELRETLLAERDDYRRRLSYALNELQRRDEMRERPRRWFRVGP